MNDTPLAVLRDWLRLADAANTAPAHKLLEAVSVADVVSIQSRARALIKKADEP